MKNLTLLLFFSFSIFNSFAQIIEGRVLDAKTNKPIEEVHVFMNKMQEGTLTNYRGRFKIRPTLKIRENDSIYFSHIGYEKRAFPYSKKKKKYLIYLDAKTNQLDEIQLIGNRKLNSSLHFNKLTSMKNGLYSFGSVLIDDKIYVIGGSSSFGIDGFRKTAENFPDLTFEELLSKAGANYSKQIHRGDLLIYNIESDSWEMDTLKFRKRAFHNINLYENKIYVLGGTRVSRNGVYEYLDDKIEVLNLVDKSIKVDNTNPHQAVNFASFTYNDKIILVGGSIKKKKNGIKKYSNKVHLYNLKSGFWYELATMPSAKEAKGILIDDKIYTFGGFNERPLTAIESLDLITGKWQKEGELFIGLSKPAITYANYIVYLFENGKLMTYNIKTKELKQYTIELFLNESELYYASGKLFILGGFRDEDYSILPSRGLFRVDLNQFEITRVKKSKRL